MPDIFGGNLFSFLTVRILLGLLVPKGPQSLILKLHGNPHFKSNGDDKFGTKQVTWPDSSLSV